MPSPRSTNPPQGRPGAPIFGLLKNYRGLTGLLLLLALAANGLNLTIPKLVAHGIDNFNHEGRAVMSGFLLDFLLLAGTLFVIAYLQSIAQAYVGERVAKDLRDELSSAIAEQSASGVQKLTPSRLLTSLTSDIDAVKMFVAQAIVSVVSSVFLIIGASTLLIITNWRLALAALAIVPAIGLAFGFIFGKVGTLFKRTQETIDRLNKVINESILGSALIRVLHAEQPEYDKFLQVNTEAKTIGFSILRLFASLIPIVTFFANLAVLVILLLGGHYVIQGSMTLGSFSAFNSYIGMLIFPIMMIGFMSSMIGRASASYQRIHEVLHEPRPQETGTITAPLKGALEVQNLSLRFGEKDVLKDISFHVEPGTKTAILGPTAAGKTQLLSLLVGLESPTSGTILYDGKPLAEYEKSSFHKQVGFVFQDSVLFYLSLRENIAFNEGVSEASLRKAIETAELQDFIDTLPEGLDTQVSERGTSLSGGQKQRLMLARALTLEPKILFLDDFTARVDIATEQRILENVRKNYPGLTLISVTQKVAAVQDYEQIILLMEGEILAKGTHTELLASSPEYAQLEQSQASTTHYELRAE